MHVRRIVSGLAAIAVVLMVNPAPASAAPALTVTPSTTNLVGGQDVEATASGFPQTAQITLCLGVPPQGAAASAPCSQYGGPSQNGDGTAMWSGFIPRFIYIASLARWVDCANEQCAFVAYQSNDIAGTKIVQPISFAPPPPPPPHRGSVTVTPATNLHHDDAVAVHGTGFRANVEIDVFECAGVPNDRPDCGTYALGHTTTDSSGSFDSGARVSGSVAPPGGTAVSCAAPGACSLAAFESADPNNTIVSTSLTFASDFTINPPTVSPGGTVTVTGSGLPPNTAVPLCETPESWPSDPERMCAATAQRGIADVDATGHFTTTLRIDRYLVFHPIAAVAQPSPGPITVMTDCAVEACVVRANFYNDGIVLSAPVLLTPTPPPPASRGSIQVSPTGPILSGTQVNVVGTGFRPGAPVDVLQCRPGIVNIADCNVPFVRTVADATGHFAASPTVRDYVGPSHVFDIHGVAPYDCVITSVDCVIAAAEETDFEHTVVSTPVDVLVTPVINVSAPLVSEHSGQMQVSVQLSRPSAQVVSVDWATVRDETNPLDPIPGIDYVAATGVVTFQPGTTQAYATVTLLDDNMYEPQERLMFAFTNPVNATLSNNGVASGGILNDDPQPQVLPRNTSTVEGDNGSHTVDVTVALSNPSYQTITVPWNTVTPAPTFAPPAQAGVDFATASGTLVFAPGESSKTVSITVNGDNQAEVDETFGVTLGVPTNATRPTGLKHVGWVTIVDDDSVVVQPGTGSVVEGDTGTSTLQVPVTLSTPWPDPVVVSWRTIFPAGGGSGLADPSSDYTAANGTVTFAPGETTKVVNVAVNGDDVPEPDEFVLVAFASTTPNVRVGGLWGLGGGIITNDD